MGAQRTQRSLTRLAEMKRQQVDALRADLMRLRDLQQQVEREHAQALEVESGFIDVMRAAEQRSGMRADTMIEHRAYLAHLSAGVFRCNESVRRVVAQVDEARDALERARKDVKVLEKLFERRAITLRGEAQRKDYIMADAQQLVGRAGKACADG